MISMVYMCQKGQNWTFYETIKIDGQIISGKTERVPFVNSATTRIFPFLQQGHRVISMPVSLNIISSMDFSVFLSIPAD